MKMRRGRSKPTHRSCRVPTYLPLCPVLGYAASREMSRKETHIQNMQAVYNRLNGWERVSSKNSCNVVSLTFHPVQAALNPRHPEALKVGLCLVSQAMGVMLLLALAYSLCLSAGWPALYTDCSVFPDVGQPQQRGPPSVRQVGWLNHPPMGVLCEPHPPTSFEWCMGHCSIHQGQQSCSTSKCTCKEHCMGTQDVCLGSGAPQIPSHYSLPDALAARPGQTKLLLDGKPPTHYTQGATHQITVIPDGDRSSASTWFLLDSGVGRFSLLPGADISKWQLKCDGTRASFASETNSPVNLFWTAPENSNNHAVALRVAAATSMGNLTINGAVLNSTAHALPPGETGYFCMVSQAAKVIGTGSPVPMQQCISMPAGTVGAMLQQACEAACFQDSGTYFCARCSHVYDPVKDGNGSAFEDLPESWRCPLCGAPKAAYAKQLRDTGDVAWVHI